MRITMKQTTFGGRSVRLDSIEWPRSVPLADIIHPPLIDSASSVQALFSMLGVGRAVRLWRSPRRVVYWAWRRGGWSADCRRVGDRLQLIGFADFPAPGFPVGTR